MKKIMKKALSLVLALVMVVALTPMTAKADELGTMDNADPLEGGSTTITLDSGESYYFYHFATEGAGDYTLTVTSDVAGIQVDVWDGMNWQYLTSHDINGNLSTTVGVSMITMFVADFIVTNTSMTTATYDVALSLGGSGEGGSGDVEEPVGNALVLDEVYAVEVALNEWSRPEMIKVSFTAPEAGTYEFGPADGETNADLYVVDNFGSEWIEELPYVFTLEANETVTFGVSSLNFEADTIEVIVTVSDGEGGSEGGSGDDFVAPAYGTGTEDDPYCMMIGNNAAVLENADDYIYYVYEAEAQGALFITMNSENWFYAGHVNNDSEQFINPNKPYTTNMNESTDDDPQALKTVYLNAGDKVIFKVSTANDESWTRPAGTVVFNAFFLEGLTPDGGETVKEESVVDYDTQLVLGANDVTLNPDAYTTIYEFVPETSGVYTITTNSGLVGYWGTGTFFTYDYTGDEKTDVLVHEIKDDEVGNSIMVGITGEGDVTITIEKTDDAGEREEIPTEVYTNVIWPGLYTVDTSNLEGVDVWDNDKNVAVMDEDGVYHLDSVDGPVLYANLNDSIVSLYAAYGYGQVNGAEYDENGEPVKIIDFNEAFYLYYNYSNGTGYYPLTIDLVTIFQSMGKAQGWYEEGNFVEGTYPEDEAWMFACYYDPSITSIEAPFDYEAPDSDDDGDKPGNTPGTGGDNEGNTPDTDAGDDGSLDKPSADNTTKPEPPKTGDATNVVLWISILGLGVIAVSGSAVMRKRNF